MFAWCTGIDYGVHEGLEVQQVTLWRSLVVRYYRGAGISLCEGRFHG